MKELSHNISRSLEVAKLQGKDYVTDQLATALNILEDAGARRDGYLWKKVQKTYLSHHLLEKLERARAGIECRALPGYFERYRMMCLLYCKPRNWNKMLN
jgi:hypothetical protein